MAMYILQPVIQHYAWGSPDLIPALLGIDNRKREAFAEVWMGAHTRAPSCIPLLNTTLDEYIIDNPDTVFGPLNQGQHDSLPFLFKILAVASPLSIQAHPDRKSAAEGFLRENSLGIPLDAPDRNYRDTNHKPEILCALSSFHAMCGFRPVNEIRELFMRFEHPELAALAPETDDLRRFFLKIMQLSKNRTAELCSLILKKAGKREEEPWEWVSRLGRHYPDDIAILSPLFLNLVHLEPGEAIYLPAGVLHAYLEGLGVELMASSDNVLRGGLTKKHIDLKELENILVFSSAKPVIMKPWNKGNNYSEYPAPTGDFVLGRLDNKSCGSPVKMENSSASILLNLGSGALLSDGVITIKLNRGESVFIEAVTREIMITPAENGPFLFFRAGIPS